MRRSKRKYFYDGAKILVKSCLAGSAISCLSFLKGPLRGQKELAEVAEKKGCLLGCEKCCRDAAFSNYDKTAVGKFSKRCDEGVKEACNFLSQIGSSIKKRKHFELKACDLDSIFCFLRARKLAISSKLDDSMEYFKRLCGTRKKLFCEKSITFLEGKFHFRQAKELGKIMAATSFKK
mgnify:FL=1